MNFVKVTWQTVASILHATKWLCKKQQYSEVRYYVTTTVSSL